MSYDLMVFDPKAPPTGRDSFMEWYNEQTQWSEEHNYDNPDVSTLELRTWYMEIIKQFPPMNGPYATDDIDNPQIADYCVGKSVIYVAFSWSQAEVAYPVVFSLAKKYKIGFFDVSGDNEEVWVPGPDEKYFCIHTR
jgi:hypothetical protein